MTDLTDEALDALVAQSRSGIKTKSMTMYKGETVDLVETFNLQMRMATTITALRAREAAIVAAAFEVLCNVLYCCDTEAQAIANRISGPRGERNRCPDGVQVLEDAETIIRAAAALVTPSDATAALAARDAAMIARGMRRAAGVATSFLVGDPLNGIPLRNPMAHEVAGAILARAAEIERDGK